MYMKVHEISTALIRTIIVIIIIIIIIIIIPTSGDCRGPSTLV